MNTNIVRYLNRYYYGILFLAVLAATMVYYSLLKGWVSPVALDSPLGMVMQYFVIFDALCSIPLGLYWFKRRCRELAKMEDKQAQLEAYRLSARWRIVLVSNDMVFGIIAYYLMGGYSSMIWMTAIAAIGWYFTKPTEKKIFLELNTPEDEQY